jgi:hypothetical protein
MENERGGVIASVALKMPVAAAALQLPAMRHAAPSIRRRCTKAILQGYNKAALVARASPVCGTCIYQIVGAASAMWQRSKSGFSPSVLTDAGIKVNLGLAVK